MAIYGSDYLDYEKTVKRGMGLIKQGGNIATFGLFVVVGANMALRVSDLLKLTYDDLKSDYFYIKEKKTGKKRKIKVNSNVRTAVDAMPDSAQKDLGGDVFVSQKGAVYSPQQLNRLMKKYLGDMGQLVTTHSLRKTFARRYYDIKKDDQLALVRLMTQLNHISPKDTLRYIGITEEETTEMFDDIV